MSDDWGLMENWDESGSLSELIDETVRAAIRCVNEAVKIDYVHDGTRMILIPEVLFNRLNLAIGKIEETGEYA